MHFIFRDSDNSPITEVWVSADKKTVRYKDYKYQNCPVLTAFCGREHPGWKDIQDFFERRSFSRGRADLPEILKSLHMKKYDPEVLVRYFNGRTEQDDCWVEFLEDA